MPGREETKAAPVLYRYFRCCSAVTGDQFSKFRSLLFHLPATGPAAKTSISDSAAALMIITPSSGASRSFSVTLCGPPI
jgi:hypothetical protein